MSPAPDGEWTALVLAGSRGPTDPVASHCGVRHKALAPVAGIPMIIRVLRSLTDSRHVGRIAICVETPEVLADLPEIAALAAAGRLVTIPASTSPSASVGAALRDLGQPYPLLVTTADHPLLTAAMVDHFCQALAGGGDVAVGVAAASLIRRDHPGAVRTFYRMGRESYSGCNLFAFRTPRAARAAAFWSDMERHRKRPWRLIAAIGPLVLLRFALGLFDLRAAERLLSRRTGAAVQIVEMPYAEAAIDVDKPADLALAERILRDRA